jgi:hypothetical protein
MSPRPYWKGYLKLALVSCPIALHAVCSSTERVSFRQINRKTGNRLRQQLIDCFRAAQPLRAGAGCRRVRLLATIALQFQDQIGVWNSETRIGGRAVFGTRSRCTSKPQCRVAAAI